MRIKQLFILWPALLLAACGPSGGGHGGFPPPQVSVITVEPKTLPASFEYTGQTPGSREVEVRARVTGILLSRNFVEGGPVTKGQSLFTIDPAPFVAAAVRAEADVAGAEARLAQAKKNAARLKPLYAEKAVSQKEFDDASSAEAIAEADLKAARARLTEAQLNLLYTKVESPATGIAGRSQRSEGSLVSGPDVLLTTVTQIDPIWVSFGIPDNDQLQHQQRSRGGPPRAAEGRPLRGVGEARRRHGVRPDRQAEFLRRARLRRHRHERDARRAPQSEGRAAPGPVRARDAEGRDAAERGHGAAARGAGRPAGQVRLRRRRQEHRRSRARCRSATGSARTGSSNRASRRATR